MTAKNEKQAPRAGANRREWSKPAYRRVAAGQAENGIFIGSEITLILS